MTTISATPQRFYLIQLSTATIPLVAGRTLPMVCVCFLVETSDGKHILIDSGLPADYTPPPGTPTAEQEKMCLSSSPILVWDLPISISSSVPISTWTMRAITMPFHRQNTSSSANTMHWRAVDTRALPPRVLTNLAQVDASPFDDVALEYINPHTGGPTMHTFTCWIQMLRPAVQTRAHRHVSSSVYHVFEGRGETIINGVRFAWEQGICLSSPPGAGTSITTHLRSNAPFSSRCTIRQHWSRSTSTGRQPMESTTGIKPERESSILWLSSNCRCVANAYV